MDLIKQLDKYLLELAWSLWTEIGVAGVKRNHQQVLILVEELILFTSALAKEDPRLRDESLDWCSKYSRFISISRMNSIKEDFEDLIKEQYSQYVATLNELSNTKWVPFINSSPLKVILSGKSVLRPHASPALLNIRVRSIFGTGARADLITFFLVHPNRDFSISEATEIGYTKRNLAEVLDDLYFGDLFTRYMKGNQQRYQLNKNSHLFEALGTIPKFAPSWRLIFKVLLSLRACIQRTENLSDSTKLVEIRTCLSTHENTLRILRISPPPLQSHLSEYLYLFNQWILDWTSNLANGNKKYLQ